AVLTPISALVPVGGETVAMPAAAASANATVAETAIVPTGSGPRSVVPYTVLIGPFLAVVWLAGTAFLLMRFALDYARVRLLRRASAFFQNTEDGVDIRISDNIAGPLAAGVLNPVIIVPTAMANAADRSALAHAIAHERAHIHRGDLIANAAEAIALSLFWWNPALHLLRRAISANREMACDDRAVRETRDAPGYAAAMIACAERVLSAPAQHNPQTVLGATGDRRAFTRRIERLLAKDYAADRGSCRARLAAAAAGVAAVTLCAAAASPRIDLAGGALTRAGQAAPETEAEKLGRRLVQAVLAGDRAWAEDLLSEGTDINAVLEGDGTALIAAVNEGDAPLAAWLIERGADVDAYALYDETALISAVRNSDIGAVRLLLDAGADPNLSARTETGAVRSPLGEARR
ncbi:MAG: M56 family metallopeptidase, partial [Hyphococcus sp.]